MSDKNEARPFGARDKWGVFVWRFWKMILPLSLQALI